MQFHSLVWPALLAGACFAPGSAGQSPPNVPSRLIPWDSEYSPGSFEHAAIGDFTTKRRLDLVVLRGGAAYFVCDPWADGTQSRLPGNLTSVTGATAFRRGIGTTPSEIVLAHSGGLSLVVWNSATRAFVHNPLGLPGFIGAKHLAAVGDPLIPLGGSIVGAVGATIHTAVYGTNAQFVAGTINLPSNITRLEFINLDGGAPEISAMTATGSYLLSVTGTVLHSCSGSANPSVMAVRSSIPRLAHIENPPPAVGAIRTRGSCADIQSIDIADLDGVSPGPLLRLSAFDVRGNGHSEFLLSYRHTHSSVLIRPAYGGGNSIGSTARRLAFDSLEATLNTQCAPLWCDLNFDGRPEIVQFSSNDSIAVIGYDAAAYGDTPPSAVNHSWQPRTSDGRSLRLAKTFPSATVSVKVFVWHQAHPLGTPLPPSPTPAMTYSGPVPSGGSLEFPLTPPPSRVEEDPLEFQFFWPDRDHYYLEVVSYDISGKVIDLETAGLTLLTGATDTLANAATYLRSLPALPGLARLEDEIFKYEGLGVPPFGIVIRRIVRPPGATGTVPTD